VVGIAAEASRALDRLGVRNDAIPPAPGLVAEQAKATGRARPTVPSATSATMPFDLTGGARLLVDEADVELAAEILGTYRTHKEGSTE
jgi:hypothetical protein